MSIKARNRNLQKLLGIIPPDAPPETPSPDPSTKKEIETISEDNKQIAIPTDQQKDLKFYKEMRRSKKKLSKMYGIAENVLENSADIATEFQRSRDVEAFSVLLKSMTELVSKRVEIDKALYKPEETTKESAGIKNQQNIFVGDMRQLNDIIKKNVTDKILDVKGEVIDDTKKDV